MNYKNMALVALLLPAFCYSQTKENRIKELEDRQWEKLLEVKKIEKEIANSYKFTKYARDHLMEEMSYALEREKKKNLLQKIATPTMNR